MKLDYTFLKFENLNLTPNQAVKVRGYFANKYNDISIMHNHHNDKFIYRYPKVQYKVIDNNPIICGILEGADFIASIGLNEDKIVINQDEIYTYQKKIIKESIEFGITENYIKYSFITPWLALNQSNFMKYEKMNEMQKEEFLKKILIGNILSMSKSLKYKVDKKIYVSIDLKECNVNFKNVKMKGFKGNFKVNFNIPQFLGMGKSVSQGFGTVKKSSNRFM
ncbi:CRISPR-associated endonuclease Cas6 [Tepidibacter formicigenes]|jgi:hypothetical protein|uniref:DNA repair protein n=1 Tax=Tepidibacter formicigenes DSM 15518 TaxID=1123349 RepID=A0A1M6LM66_9FIRM|nr:CRISPR-associated endonuclease Cas6 [Tepidibacter formicigenes]SHJ72307.1 hypothetical protein SAMN02744037_00690 [Tepidibacter formicigenes DSM 15518]